MDKYSVLLIFVTTLIILSLYWFNRGKLKKKKQNKKGYDLIVKFNHDSYIDITKNSNLSKLAVWNKYGEYSFRGFSSINKLELEKCILEEFNLNEEDFTVMKGNPGLYIPS